ncbi:MAG: hypothetical protein A2020_10875 [Lentisphaerae bacterium GWF2_45_14]|nr:MAG: hypothetical protein A2020_10875 [Lentisphaerae bacterium GWF2_45_14]
MINPFSEINWTPDKDAVHRFGKSMLIGFPCLALLFLAVSVCRGIPLSHALIFPISLTVAGILIWTIAANAPRLALVFYYPWFFLAACIGFFLSNLLLVIFYYLIFSGIAVIVRSLTSRDPLSLKYKEGQNSWWVEHKSHSDLKRYFKQY